MTVTEPEHLEDYVFSYLSQERSPGRCAHPSDREDRGFLVQKDGRGVPSPSHTSPFRVKRRSPGQAFAKPTGAFANQPSVRPLKTVTLGDYG
jgi:hypothetical protein